MCHGFKDEQQCLPCLDAECVTANPQATLDNNKDEFCSICFISGLGDRPSIQLGCRHIFHVECLLAKIKMKWSGPRITFLFTTCPSCKRKVDAPHHPEINKAITEAADFETLITEKALERANIEGLAKDPRL
jgi:E3 ubiquitin-protein ligase MYCBP2